MKPAVLLSILLALFSTDGQAQQPQSVGHIQQIAIQRGELVTATEDAQFLRIGGSVPARTAAPLYRRDLLRLYEPLFIDLLFSQSSLNSRAVLGPSLQESAVSLEAVSLENVGTYEILENTVDPLSRLQLIVRHGAMVIEHVSGRLDVLASGTRTRIFGTTALFDVGADTTEGFLFLMEGHIRFPDYDLDATGENRAWRLRPGVAPQELILARQAKRHYRETIEYYTTSVWQDPVPFWKKATFIVPAAAVVVGGAVYLLTRGGDGYTPPERSGMVAIYLPN